MARSLAAPVKRPINEPNSGVIFFLGAVDAASQAFQMTIPSLHCPFKGNLTSSVLQVPHVLAPEPFWGLGLGCT